MENQRLRSARVGDRPARHRGRRREAAAPCSRRAPPPLALRNRRDSPEAQSSAPLSSRRVSGHCAGSRRRRGRCSRREHVLQPTTSSTRAPCSRRSHPWPPHHRLVRLVSIRDDPLGRCVLRAAPLSDAHRGCEISRIDASRVPGVRPQGPVQSIVRRTHRGCRPVLSAGRARASRPLPLSRCQPAAVNRCGATRPRPGAPGWPQTTAHQMVTIIIFYASPRAPLRVLELGAQPPDLQRPPRRRARARAELFADRGASSARSRSVDSRFRSACHCAVRPAAAASRSAACSARACARLRGLQRSRRARRRRPRATARRRPRGYAPRPRPRARRARASDAAACSARAASALVALDARPRRARAHRAPVRGGGKRVLGRELLVARGVLGVRRRKMNNRVARGSRAPHLWRARARVARRARGRGRRARRVERLRKEEGNERLELAPRATDRRKRGVAADLEKSMAATVRPAPRTPRPRPAKPSAAPRIGARARRRRRRAALVAAARRGRRRRRRRAPARRRVVVVAVGGRRRAAHTTRLTPRLSARAAQQVGRAPSRRAAAVRTKALHALCVSPIHRAPAPR